MLDKIQKIPQASSQEVASVVGAGEGDFALGPPATALSFWETGRIDITMVTSSPVPPPWDKDPNIVTLAEAGLSSADMPIGLIIGMAIHGGVPKEHIDWLYKLFKAGAETDLFMKREKTIPGCKISIMGPEESDKLLKTYQDAGDPIVRSMGLHLDQQKK